MRRPTRTALIRTAFVTCFVTCGGEDRADTASPAPARRSPARHTEALHLLGEIVVEENERVINVAPIVFDDTDGGFLVADLKESQVRVYERGGSLSRALGGRGDGPGEFRSPVVVHRLPDGRIVAGDFENARLTLFSADADSVLDTQTPPLFLLYNAVPLSSERLLLAGRPPGAGRPPLLHIWNMTSEEIETSFFPVPVRPDLAGTALSLGFVGLDVLEDTLYATFSLTDTLYAFDLGSSPPRPAGKIPIPIEDFRIVAPPMEASASVMAREEWLSGLTPIQAVHALPRSFLVLFGEDLGTENLWHWSHFARDGTPLFQLRDAGQVLTTRADTIFFIDPRAMVPNRWTYAVTRSW